MRRIIGILAFVIAMVGMSGPAMAGQGERPLRGTVTGDVVFVPVEGCAPVGLQTQGTGSGIVTHLGRVELASRHCTPPGADITAGRMILTAANGDKLYLDYAGPCDVPSPDWVPGTTQFSCHNAFTVAGGTGRFADATGAGELHALVTFMGMEVPVWPVTWTFSARLRY